MKLIESWSPSVIHGIVINAFWGVLVTLLIMNGGSGALEEDTPLPPLARPQLEWVSCGANGATLGLNDQDYIKLQMYLSSIKASRY